MRGEISERAFFVTVKVEPHMKVMRNRKISALGIPSLWLVSLSIVCFIGCTSKQNDGVLPKNKLAHVYADIVYARQLYAGNPVAYEHARDSLLQAHATDTTAIRV